MLVASTNPFRWMPTEDLSGSEAMSDIQRPDIAHDHGDRQPETAIRRFRIAESALLMHIRYSLLRAVLFTSALGFFVWSSRKSSHFGAEAISSDPLANPNTHKHSCRESKPVALISGAMR